MRQLSRYSYELRAGRSGFHSRQGKEIILYSTASRRALGPTQPSVQWVPRVQGGAAGAWSWPSSSAEVKNPHKSSWCGAELFKHGNNYTSLHSSTMKDLLKSEPISPAPCIPKQNAHFKFLSYIPKFHFSDLEISHQECKVTVPSLCFDCKVNKIS
jgi:hypothetical protein